MTLDWLIYVPDPVANLNSVIEAWRARQTARYDAQAEANFQASGIISTDRDFFIEILDEAESRIRERVNQKLDAMAEAAEFVGGDGKPN